MDFNELLKKEQTYIIGVSGGCDSMALLDMLNKIGYHLIVCHVNYHLRHDSDLDQETVSDYCSKYDIPCFIKEIDPNSYGNENFQSQARELRYKFYFDIGKKYSTNKVILAHHYDDVLETIVMQLQRNNIKGYLGIKPISEVYSMEVIRPCLSLPKDYLRSYCHSHDIVYHDDYTNFQTDFTRDYVRNVTLKKYSQEDKDKLYQRACLHNKKYLDKISRLKNYLDVYNQNKVIDYTIIDESLLELFIYEILRDIIYPPLISDSLLKEIIKQLKSGKPNVNITLPVNIRFIKEYNNIRVSKADNNQGYSYSYDDLVYGKSDYFSLEDKGHINEGVFLSKKDFPITIRSARAGDVIVCAGGTKKVSRLFIDKKIPKSMRILWPVVENADGQIVLVPHLAKNIGYLYSKPNIYVVKL